MVRLCDEETSKGGVLAVWRGHEARVRKAVVFIPTNSSEAYRLSPAAKGMRWPTRRRHPGSRMRVDLATPTCCAIALCHCSGQPAKRKDAGLRVPQGTCCCKYLPKTDQDPSCYKTNVSHAIKCYSTVVYCVNTFARARSSRCPG